MSRVALLFAVLAAAAGCRGRSAAPDGRDFAHATAAIDHDLPGVEDMKRLTYAGIGQQTVSLRNGVWAARPGAAAEFTRVELRAEPVLAGDVTGNGRDEAVVFLEATRATGPSRLFVAVVASSDTHVINLATAAVGDGVRVAGGQVTLGTVALDVEGPAGASRLTYRLEGRTLRMAGGDARP
jgi:hypothetical protein